MIPSGLKPESFRDYPPVARAFATEHIDLLRQLPLVFAGLLTREIRRYDWSFPAERQSVDRQISYLGSLSRRDRDHLLHGFALNGLPNDVRKLNWIRNPEVFVDVLTAWLWSSHRIDAFRAAAKQYSDAWREASPEPAPPAPRLSIVVLDKDLRAPGYQLFRKLRSHGVFFPAVDATHAWPEIFRQINDRASKYPGDFRHWYIDGASTQRGLDEHVSAISWESMEPVRTAVLARMHAVIAGGNGGPEQLRTRMAETDPHLLGLPSTADNDAFTRFKVSLMTEGSGTQIFSTTFVQWAAREALRRAQPCTLLLRFAPRQRQLPMNEMLAGNAQKNAADPEGSLVDADMGAFYTWVGQQRLSGANDSGFIAWSEAHNQAIAVSPTAPRGVTSPNLVTLRQLFQQFV
jgi:hypothetical protein